MKSKILGILIISFLVVFTCGFTYATSEEKIEADVNIDDSKNISIIVKSSNIKYIKLELEYDSDLIEYIGVEEKNNWSVTQEENSSEIIMKSNNANNSIEKDIAILKFKAVNIENIDETCISLKNVISENEDGQLKNLDDLDVVVTVNNETEEDDDSTEGETEEEAFIPDESEEQVEDQNQEFEGDTEEEKQQENSETEEYYSPVEENEEEKIDNSEETAEVKSNDELENGNEDYKDTEPEAEEDQIEEKKVEQQKESLANKILPQTGIILTVIPATLAVGAAIIAGFWFKKYKSIK